MTPIAKFKKPDTLLIAVLLLGVGALFAAFPPAYQHWDALVYAYRAQASQLAPSLYSHHALSNLLLYGAVRALLSLHVVNDSVSAFQTVNMVLSALTAALVYSMARAWGNSRLLSLCVAVMLVASYGFWHLAGTADLYVWITLATLLFWWSAAQAATKPTDGRLALAGVAAGVAVLAWQPNALLAGLFGLVYLIDVGRNGRPLFRSLLMFAAPAVILTTLGYLLLGWLANAHSVADFTAWYVGYFGNSNYGNQLTWGNWPIVRGSAQRAVLAPPYLSKPYHLAYAGIWLALAVIVLGAAYGWRHKDERSGVLLWLNLAWFVGLGLASWWFDPYAAKFWLVAWLSIVLTTLPGLGWWRAVRLGRWPVGPAFVATTMMGLLLYNFMVGIRPEHQIKNYQIEAARTWRQHTMPDDLLFIGLDFRTYLDYYADRHHVVCPECVYDAVSAPGGGGVALWVRQALEAAERQGVAIYRAADVCQGAPVNQAGWCSAEMVAVLDAYVWQPAFEVFDGHANVTVYQAFAP